MTINFKKRLEGTKAPVTNTAQKVREMKEKNPQAYCPKCLWRTNGNYTPCPRHAPKTQENTK